MKLSKICSATLLIFLISSCALDQMARKYDTVKFTTTPEILTKIVNKVFGLISWFQNNNVCGFLKLWQKKGFVYTVEFKVQEKMIFKIYGVCQISQLKLTEANESLFYKVETGHMSPKLGTFQVM